MPIFGLHPWPTQLTSGFELVRGIKEFREAEGIPLPAPECGAGEEGVGRATPLRAITTFQSPTAFAGGAGGLFGIRDRQARVLWVCV